LLAPAVTTNVRSGSGHDAATAQVDLRGPESVWSASLSMA
jgi:hypothetical protein